MRQVVGQKWLVVGAMIGKMIGEMMRARARVCVRVCERVRACVQKQKGAEK